MSLNNKNAFRLCMCEYKNVCVLKKVVGESLNIFKFNIVKKSRKLAETRLKIGYTKVIFFLYFHYHQLKTLFEYEADTFFFHVEIQSLLS